MTLLRATTARVGELESEGWLAPALANLTDLSAVIHGEISPLRMLRQVLE